MEVDAQLWLKQNNVILATSIFEWLKEFKMLCSNHKINDNHFASL